MFKLWASVKAPGSCLECLTLLFFICNFKTRLLQLHKETKDDSGSASALFPLTFSSTNIFSFFPLQAVISPLSSGAVLYTFVYETRHVVSAPRLEKWRCFEALMSHSSHFTPTCSWKRFYYIQTAGHKYFRCLISQSLCSSVSDTDICPLFYL